MAEHTKATNIPGEPGRICKVGSTRRDYYRNAMLDSTPGYQQHHLASAQPIAIGIEAVRGDGAWIEATDGRRYLDLAAGIATCNLGHSHPAVIAAVLEQMNQVIHLGGVCGHAPLRDLADRLAGISPTGVDQFLFSTTGSEANETALRLARAATGRPGVVCFRGSFHGRTQGALAATTSKAAFRLGLGGGNVHVAPFPRPDEMEMSVEEAARHALKELDQLHRHQLSPKETACYVIEPVQGHGGCHPAGRDFLEGLRERADTHGALLVFDEIQTGFGRTGDWFAALTYGVRPDVMTMAKALGAGFPLSAIGANEEVMSSMGAGDHGSTFGGNPVSCAAAIAGIDAMEAEDLPAHARDLGAYAMTRLGELVATRPELKVRGLGLMIGIEVNDGAASNARPDLTAGIQAAALREGVMVITSGAEANVIRILPPLVITDEELELALDVIEHATSEVLDSAR